jgi:hypothetical protein
MASLLSSSLAVASCLLLIIHSHTHSLSYSLTHHATASHRLQRTHSASHRDQLRAGRCGREHSPGECCTRQAAADQTRRVGRLGGHFPGTQGCWWVSEGMTWYALLQCCTLCLVVWGWIVYCIVLYCIVLYCVVLCCVVLYCIVLYCIVLYCIVLYCNIAYCGWCIVL